MSHLFIPDQGLPPTQLASLPEAEGAEEDEGSTGVTGGRGTKKGPPPSSKAGTGTGTGKKSRRASVTVGAINRASALSSAAARRGSTRSDRTALSCPQYPHVTCLCRLV